MKKVTLKGKITILGFPGSNIEEVKADLFNLNQKFTISIQGLMIFKWL